MISSVSVIVKQKHYEVFDRRFPFISKSLLTTTTALIAMVAVEYPVSVSGGLMNWKLKQERNQFGNGWKVPSFKNPLILENVCPAHF